MEASRRRVPLGLALPVRALVRMLVRVAVWPGVVEPRMRGRARRHGASARLAVESRGCQAAGAGPVRGPLGTEAAAGLLHRLRHLTSQHAPWSLVSYEVIDAEHAGLTRSKPGRRGRRVICRGQLLPVGRADRHVVVD